MVSELASRSKWEEEGGKPGQDRKPPTPMIADAADTADAAQEAKAGGAGSDEEGPDAAPAKLKRDIVLKKFNKAQKRCEKPVFKDDDVPEHHIG